MQDISLQALLEAGSHFGHKAERWHPKASSFIYTEKDGIHIIDLAKTKVGLEKAAEFIRDTVAGGQEVLFVATKRQARGVVKEEVETVKAPYFVERWIGGFLTNWDSIKKNIDNIITLASEEASGAWKKFPKHEQVKLSRYLARLRVFYGGVLEIKGLPGAVFIVDVKKEISALREAKRMGIPVVAIVDTNSDPTLVDYVIPGNDDAVGSIQFITHVIAGAYKEGKELRQKEVEKTIKKEEKEKAKTEAAKIEAAVSAPSVDEKEEVASVPAEKPKKSGRPKKTV